ncbi:MAG TPA: hypothetical protein ENK18_13120 [Deltaproteobacteria bacterium]|nr:hypothetical protein [Deltaproteobacteria bacterium]
MGRRRHRSPEERRQHEAPGAAGEAPTHRSRRSALRSLGFKVYKGGVRLRTRGASLVVELDRAPILRGKLPGVAQRLHLGPERPAVGLRRLVGLGDLRLGLPELDLRVCFQGDRGALVALATPPVRRALIAWVPRGLTLADGVLTQVWPPDVTPGVLRSEVYELVQLARMLTLRPERLAPRLSRIAASDDHEAIALAALQQLAEHDPVRLTTYRRFLIRAHHPTVRLQLAQRLKSGGEDVLIELVLDPQLPSKIRERALQALAEERPEPQPGTAPQHIERLLTLTGLGPPLDEALASLALARISDAPHLLAHCSEELLLALLRRCSGSTRIGVITHLGDRGTPHSLPELLPLTRGMLRPRLKEAASQARDRIIARGGVSGGEISLATEGGGLALDTPPPESSKP